MKQSQSQKSIIILGNLNAKVEEKNIIGPYGCETRNQNGEYLVKRAKQNKLIISNT